MAFRCLSLEIFKITKPILKPGLLRKESKIVVMGSQNFFSEPVSKSIELISKNEISVKKDNRVPLVTTHNNKPLAVLFEWISAEKKAFYKYADLYLDRGYDVLAISLSVRNLVWPISGAQIVADEALEFLTKNKTYDPLLVHGFSIGGYVWGEVLVKIAKDLPKYQPLIDRIKGQIWDSTPDVACFHKGFPKAVFPNNDLLRLIMEKCVWYHLKFFHNTATKHYYNSSEAFHKTPVKAPALFFIAKNDPVASYDLVVQLKDHWESLGRKAYLKSWEKSKHVGHLRLYREEYIKTLDDFLKSLEEPHAKDKTSEKIQAKL